MKTILLTLTLPGLGFLASPFTSAQEPGHQDPSHEPPHELPADQTCLDCHDSLLRGKLIHEPVEKQTCEVCHPQPDAKLHVFETDSDQTAACAACHDQAVGSTVHQPVMEGDCTSCHDPHHSQGRGLLRIDDQAELCATCHEDSPDFRVEFLHGPAAAGLCSLCHQPHASDQPQLLIEDLVSQCLYCHTDRSDLLDGAENIHLPVDEDCSLCHDAHASPNRYQLLYEGKKLCFQCHDSVKQKTNLSVDHAPINDERSCLTCHQPHHSDLPFLQTRHVDEMCLSCHTEAVETNDGTRLAAMGEKLAHKYRHGPIREGNCSACHDPHGSEDFRILRRAYPATFYAAFNPKLYRLCFGCHDENTFLEEFTTTTTDFRDDDLNLHYLHVNRETKGRACRACHETHASDQSKHLAATVPFGGWEMPMNFKKNEQGGSCAPGCHSAKTYRREP